MGRVISSMSMSLDGFIATPLDTRRQPPGEQPHEWRCGGTARDAGVPGEPASSTGAVIMGRRSYDLVAAGGRWGGSGPLGQVPCFVLTRGEPRHTPAPPVFTFVTDGIESAVKQAQEAAGDGDVALHGGTAAQQCLRADLLDELQIHLVPVLLGEGIRLFDHLGTRRVALERTRVVSSPGATHLHFRVVR